MHPASMLKRLDVIALSVVYVAAMFNVLGSLYHRLHPEADRFQLSLAGFSL